MKSRIVGAGFAVAAASLSFQLPVAVAAEGTWIVRGGLGYVDPIDDNLKNSLGPGTDVQVDESLSATVEAAYLFRDHWAVELLAAWPFMHDIEIDGVGNVARAEHLPPTLSLQYHFQPDARVRPYVGLGLNYTTFTHVEERDAIKNGFELELEDSWGLAAQAGVDISVRDNWFTNIGIRWIDIDTDAELNGAKLGEVEIDPFVYQLQIGYRFTRPAPAVAAATPAPTPVAAPARPADSDGDGVPDAADRCADTPRGDRVGPHGCSCDVSRQVQFAFDSAELTPEGKATLDEVATTLERLNFVSGVVVGHTDAVGSEEYNQQLSEGRAETVAAYLEANGIATGRLTASGAGEREPVASNDTEAGRAQNRRVVLRRTDCATSDR